MLAEKHGGSSSDYLGREHGSRELYGTLNRNYCSAPRTNYELQTACATIVESDDLDDMTD